MNGAPDSFDLVDRNGTVVTADAEIAADVGIAGERIAQVGGAMHGRRELDATGKLVMSGGIDVHVHLSLPMPVSDASTWCADFFSGTRAAARAGAGAPGVPGSDPA